MEKIDHLGIVVRSLENSNTIYSRLLGRLPFKSEYVESEEVEVSFFEIGESKIELIESKQEGGALHQFLQKRGEGLHHVAFEVEDIREEMKRLQQEGFRLLNEQPKIGADNKLVCFVHPKDSSGVLVELVQSITS